jgi:hypothetical protein
MADISSSGASPVPKLKDLITLMLAIKSNNSTNDLNEKMDALVEAVRELMGR